MYRLSFQHPRGGSFFSTPKELSNCHIRRQKNHRKPFLFRFRNRKDVSCCVTSKSTLWRWGCGEQRAYSFDISLLKSNDFSQSRRDESKPTFPRVPWEGAESRGRMNTRRKQTRRSIHRCSPSSSSRVLVEGERVGVLVPIMCPLEQFGEGSTFTPLIVCCC